MSPNKIHQELSGLMKSPQGQTRSVYKRYIKHVNAKLCRNVTTFKRSLMNTQTN